jgi:hypothetical protein
MRVLWTCWTTNTPYNPELHNTAREAIQAA